MKGESSSGRCAGARQAERILYSILLAIGVGGCRPKVQQEGLPPPSPIKPLPVAEVTEKEPVAAAPAVPAEAAKASSKPEAGTLKAQGQPPPPKPTEQLAPPREKAISHGPKASPRPSPGGEARPPQGQAGPPKPAPPAAARPLPVPPSEKLRQPLVVMSAAHAETCLLKVGDPMPDFALPDLAGQVRSLKSLLGERLTLVVFWSCREALGREQFRRLEKETFQPLRGAGVNVIAVNVGDNSAEVQNLYRAANASFPCLFDTEKATFRAVATAKLPRSYLLGPDGCILWMDIEYSRDARRELKNAVYFFLAAKASLRCS